MTASTHIVFGEVGAIGLGDALAQMGRTDRVLEYPDDLSFGPIATTDPVQRARWVADELGDADWQEIAPLVAAFWNDALAGSERHVVWFSRRVTRDYVGFLEYLYRTGERPCDVVDLTEKVVAVRGPDGSIRGSRRAICTDLLEAYQFLEADLFASAVPLSDEARRAYLLEWDRLCSENAALRIVMPDLRLASVPLTHFDDALMRQVRPDFQKTARIIGKVLADKWDADIYEVDEFFLSRRLLALVREGLIEGKGDLTQIRFSEVRSRS